jgi:glycerol-3-phosphate acyltransferase PlsY
MTVTIAILFILSAYLVGAIPSAVWIGKMVYGIDVRKHGSGNAGATNVIRVLGYKAGIPVLVIDILKGWIAVQLPVWFITESILPGQLVYLRIACAIMAVVGHIFPIYAGFRGGKGVGTIAGAGLSLFPLSLLIVLAVFILVLVITHYVSLSSILASVAFPLVVFFIIGERHPGLIGLSLIVAVFIPVTHRRNIKRLLKGEENKFDFKRKKSKSPQE